MKTITTINECRQTVQRIRRDGGSVGLVPTMGTLHAGHLALVSAAKTRCSHVAVTIFVNPAQFAPGEDYEKYPRTLASDLDACESAGVDILFAPPREVVYPAGHATTIHVAGVTEHLCGPFRPGHFDGVATVVAKLFHILPADVAFFGEKDYQQLVVIRRLVRDLDIPIEIVGHPTIREPDGLAMSSRNRYLTPTERQQAWSLSAALFAARAVIQEGERNAVAIRRAIRAMILFSGPATIDYVEVVDPVTLESLTEIDRPVRICLAVRIGSTRLIDNVGVDGTGSGK